jgi:hypothetical protein
MQLSLRLAEAGVRLDTADLLKQSPRDLLGALDVANADGVAGESSGPPGDGDTSQAARRAATCLSRIYTLALLEFNDRARRRARDDWRSSCYEQLVRKGVFDANARIVSFCCDTVLDEALFRRFRGCWSYDAIDVAGVNGTPMTQSGPADLRMVKPRGSLNMLWCPACGKVHIQWLLRYAAAGTDRPATSARTCPNCGCRTESEPSDLGEGPFLPALYGKQQLTDCQDSIREAFSWAQQIVAVGYQFPTDDERLWPSIAAGLAANPHTKTTVWLVLTNQEKTDALRNHLLSDNVLPVLLDSRFAVTASNLAGFESI